MNERELGKALLKLDAAILGGAPDTHQSAWRIIERDRRVMRLFAALTILPTAQRLMLGFAASRVADVGIPRLSSKITRTE